MARVLISARAATAVLTAAGVGERQARRVLSCGLVGAPTSTPASRLYEVDRVAALVARPVLDDGAADAASTCGLLVTRRDVDAQAPPGAQHGHLPLVATVGGFVVTGAEITAVLASPEGYHLELREAGEWFQTFRDRRFPTGPGRPWVLRDRVGESAS